MPPSFLRNRRTLLSFDVWYGCSLFSEDVHIVCDFEGTMIGASLLLACSASVCLGLPLLCCCYFDTTLLVLPAALLGDRSLSFSCADLSPLSIRCFAFSGHSFAAVNRVYLSLLASVQMMWRELGDDGQEEYFKKAEKVCLDSRGCNPLRKCLATQKLFWPFSSPYWSVLTIG